MNINEIKKSLKEKFNCEFVGVITCNGKQYINALSIEHNISSYYEICNNTIEQIQDENIVQYIKNTYETKDKNIIY